MSGTNAGAAAASLAASQPRDALLRALFEQGAALPLSFEMFPPKSEAGRARLAETVERLAGAATAGFSVTMGAGGSTRIGTLETAVEIARTTGRPVTAHLTALGLTRAEALETADAFHRSGVTSILALRGDVPRAAADPPPAGFEHASDLVAALAARHDFRISVAAYPEKHPEAASPDSDIDHLKAKLNAGAVQAICQFVLNPERYGRFLDACVRHGIDAPIVPGVMPLDDWPRVRAFAKTNGATIPTWLDQLFAEAAGAPEIAPLVAATATVEHARRLVAYGAPALHVYALNRWLQPLTLARMMGHTDGGDRQTKAE